ncbi:MAG: carbohydrate-binding protein, partial [Deltaproteobacteria bacterium]|nr:carbohydrate-binding protein [Deltaproteobacteria bacterium]
MKKSILMPFFLCASINLLSCGNPQQTPSDPPQIPSDPPQTQIFVSPTGSDLNPGTFQKPIASFERAQALARQLFGSMTDDLVVYFRQGTYRLTKTLEFTSEDSPTNGHRIVYSAYPGEKASISGGITITDWSQGQDKIMIAALDA